MYATWKKWLPAIVLLAALLIVVLSAAAATAQGVASTNNPATGGIQAPLATPTPPTNIYAVRWYQLPGFEGVNAQYSASYNCVNTSLAFGFQPSSFIAGTGVWKIQGFNATNCPGTPTAIWEGSPGINWVVSDTTFVVTSYRVDYWVDATPSPTPPSATTPTPASTPTPVLCGTFSDVPSDSPFYSYIRCLACRGIISGYPDGTFGPSNPVTRGQLSKIVSNSANYTETFSTNTFEDVHVGSTFFPYVERLSLHGGIAGYACGNPEPCVPPTNKPYFRPGANVTRGQTSKIVAIAKGLPAPSPGQQSFEDVAPNSTFWQWIEPLAATGAIGGYPCGGVGEPCVPPANRPYFRPGANVTRGQSAKIVSNVFFPNCSPSSK